jgi:hypothetical protein
MCAGDSELRTSGIGRPLGSVIPRTFAQFIGTFRPDQIFTLSSHLRRRVRQSFEVNLEFSSEPQVHHLAERNADYALTARNSWCKSPTATIGPTRPACANANCRYAI